MDLESCGIAHINNAFVNEGDGDYRRLFHEEDLTEESLSLAGDVEDWIAGAQAAAALADEPELAMGAQSSHPFECPFAEYCSRDEPVVEYPLSSLPNFSGRRREAVEVLGILDLREVPDLFLTDLQKHVRDVPISGETWFDAAGAAAALAPHGFPAWFLDFETVMLPVPIWKGTRPCQQIPFQFSLHRVEADGAMHHEAFLHLSGEDPLRSLAEALLAKSGLEGPVFVYNAKFERMVIHQVAARFPDLAKALVMIAKRLVELHPIAKEHFFAPSQHGKWGLSRCSRRLVRISPMTRWKG